MRAVTRKPCFWTCDGADGERELRPRAKLALSLLLISLAVALYLLLNLLGGTQDGAAIIVVLAYAIGTLMIVATFVVIIISLIEYLRSLE